MTEIVLSVSRHQSHCVFSVEFVVFQSRMGEDMLDALIVAFYSYYKQRLKKNKRCTGLCDCGFSENTRPKQVFNFENNPVPMNFWIVYMHGYTRIQTDSSSFSCCSCCFKILGIVLGMPAEQPNYKRYRQ